MYLDVVDLQHFHDRPLGAATARLIGGAIRELWPEVRGQTVLGLGFATPYLAPFRADAGRVLALMPARQGVVGWPLGEPNLTGLIEETRVPLPDASVDRLILVHSLEHSPQVGPLLREIWRLMAPSGRLVIVVPNRRGIWARLDRTPFGHGRPYSGRQLNRLLADHMLAPRRRRSALYMPPSNRRLLVAALARLEPVGRRLWRNFAGVLIVEAEKTVYAIKGAPNRRRVKQPVFIRR